MPRDSIHLVARVTILTTAGAFLAACSDLYYDHRDTVSFGAGDAVASNAAVQTIDPWPRAAYNRNIPGNGERVQAAVERYRRNKVTPLATTNTSSVNYVPVTSSGGGDSK
jgi:hypothetical protein